MFQQQNIIYLAIVIIIIVIIAYISSIIFSKDNFSNFNSENFNYSKVKTYHFTSQNYDSIFNGLVFKHIFNGKYQYVYKFNLPIPIGGDYNKTEGEYIVLAGTSENDLKPIGKLQRKSDGWFYLDFSSKENLTVTKIIFNIPSDQSKNQILFHKKL